MTARRWGLTRAVVMRCCSRAEDYDAPEETAHLLRSPANARQLLESLAQAQQGQRDERPLSR